jgi:hypothetical protein
MVEDDDFDLLEIPTETIPAQVETPANTNGNAKAATTRVNEKLAALSEIEVSPEASAHADDLNSFVEQFYVSSAPLADLSREEIKTPNVQSPEPKPLTTEPVIEKASAPVTFSPESHQDDTGGRKGGSMKLIAVAAAGVLVVALAGWGILSMAPSDSPKLSVSAETPVAVMSEPSAQPSPSDERTEPATPSKQNNSANATIEDQTDTRQTSQRTRPQTAELKKPADTRPTPKPEQKPAKKKMTVEDLLN